MDDIIDAFEKAAKALAKREKIAQLEKDGMSGDKLTQEYSALTYLEQEARLSFDDAVRGVME